MRRGAVILPEGKRRERLIAEIDAMVGEDSASAGLFRRGGGCGAPACCEPACCEPACCAPACGGRKHKCGGGLFARMRARKNACCQPACCEPSCCQPQTCLRFLRPGERRPQVIQLDF